MRIPLQAELTVPPLAGRVPVAGTGGGAGQGAVRARRPASPHLPPSASPPLGGEGAGCPFASWSAAHAPDPLSLLRAAPELEFKHGGEAHIARDPQSADEQAWTAIPVHPHATPGASSPSAGGSGRLRPLLQLPARHRERQDPGHLQDRRTEARPRPAAERRPVSADPVRVLFGGRIDRARAAPLHLRRPRLRGLCRRHAGLGAAGPRRPPRRPLVQVPPAARLPGGRLGGAERARHGRPRRRPLDAEPARHPGRALRRARRARARTTGRRSLSTSARSTSLLSPMLGGRLLLQDLHGPALRQGRKALGATCSSRRSAAPPASATPTTEPDPGPSTPTASPIATCWWSAPARPASRPRWPRPRPASASSCATRTPNSAARCSTSPGCASTASRPPTGSPHVLRDLAAKPQRHAAAAHPGLRLLQPQLRRPERAPDRPSRPPRPAGRRASGCGRCGPGTWCSRPAPSSGRWCFPTTTGPASCWPARPAPSCTATA